MEENTHLQALPIVLGLLASALQGRTNSSSCSPWSKSCLHFFTRWPQLALRAEQKLLCAIVEAELRTLSKVSSAWRWTVSHQLQSCTSHWNKMGCSEVWTFNMFSINSRDGLTTLWCVFTCTGEPQWETCWLFSNPHCGQLGDTGLSHYSYVLQFCKVCVDGLNEMIPGSKAHQTFLAFLLKVFVWRSQIS